MTDLTLPTIKDIELTIYYFLAIAGTIFAFAKWAWPRIAPLIINHLYLQQTGVNVIRDIEKHFGKEAGRVLKDIIQQRGLEIVIDEMRLNIIENAAGLGIYICNSDGRCTYANKTLAKMFGLSQHDMLGNGWIANIVDKQTAFNNWKFAVDNNTPYRDEYTIKVNGVITKYYTEAEPSLSEDGDVILGYVGIVKLAEEKQI